VIDVLVAGGGPAGLATAIHAALAGMQAVVIEPRPAPVDKACGEGLMPGGAAALRSMGIDVDGQLLRGIRYLDRRHESQAEFNDGYGLGVRRTALHTALSLRAAELGIDVVPGKVDHVRQTQNHIEAAGRRARWLVAADGLHSRLRHSLGLELPDHRPRRYGLRQHYQITPWTDFVEVHWAADGEAYVTPVGKNLVGVAVLSSQRCTYQGHLAQFPALRDRLEGPAVTHVRGAGPLRQRVRSRVAGRVLLVGDAAGYTDALTGEGITLALRSAPALVHCLRAGHPQTYERAWRSLSRRHRLLTGALLQARRHPTSARLIVPAAQHLPALFTMAVRALA
jgi:flavin-dependent dehydrogenase